VFSSSHFSSSQPRAQERHDAPALLGRYVLRGVIGRGGMATVYHALDTTLNRAFAVKLLLPQLAAEPRFVEQFLEMERRVARLFHPNLVTIYDAGIADDHCFVVMEYLPGGSLRSRLAAGQALPPRAAIRLVAQVADALQRLHEERIVHGDIKPDNVLLDEYGNAKLVDFGIAHLATTTGVIKPETLSGSVPYLAPEQVEQGVADSRSDIYALGLVAYELLAGRPPFAGDNWVAVAAQRLTCDPAPLAEVRPELPAELSRVVMRALARDPQRRYPSAAEFRAALLQVEWPRPRSAATPAAQAATAEQAAPAPPRLEPQLEEIRERARHLAVATLARAAALVHASLAELPRLRRRPPPPRIALATSPLRLPTALPLDLDAARRRLDRLLFARGARTRHRELGPLFGLVVLLALLVLPVAALRLASPARPAQVPAVQGLTLADARRRLAASGLAVGNVQEQQTTAQPGDTVITQSAAPGSMLERGRAVDLTVAAPPWTSVPSLAGLAVGDAQERLERSGLKLGAVQTRPRAEIRAGTVLEQDPAAGTRVRQGAAVSVTIAVPPPPTSNGETP